MVFDRFNVTTSICALAMASLVSPVLAQDGEETPEAEAAETMPTAPNVASTTPPEQVPPPAPTVGDPSDSGGFGEIVVTAQRRSEVLQRVPLAVSAATAEEIVEARIEGATDLSRISPGVLVTEAFGNVQINIRGLGLEQTNPAGEPSVLTYVDGIYMPRTTAIAAAFEDLERIEILRGPQGTLYGRNATGGVVNLITRTPGDELAGNISLLYGRYNRIKVAGGVEGPLADGIAARISFLHDSNDGDIQNITTGERLNDLNANAVRGTIVADVTPSIMLTLRGDYYKDKLGYYVDLIDESVSQTANPFGSTPVDPNGFFDNLDLGPGSPPLPNDGRRVANDALDPHLGRRNYGFSATAEFELSNDISLKSVSAYRNSYNKRRRIDQDGAPSQTFREAFADEYSEMISQELNLNGDTGGVVWVAGLYYFRETLDLEYLYNYYTVPRIVDFLFGLPDGTTPNTYTFAANGTTKSFSGFAQAAISLSDQTTLTLGARQNFDRKRLSQEVVIFGADTCGGFADSSGKWNDLTWKVGLDHQITPNNMVYALVSKGFKAGGVNISDCGSTFEPESVINYEIGTKNTFLNGNLLVNAGAFYYDYTDLQVNIYTQTTNATQNASGSRVYGAEFEIRTRPVRNLEIGGNASYLYAEYRDFFSANPLTQASGQVENLSGFDIAHAPTWQLNGNVNYTVPIGMNELKLRYDVRHSSSWWGDNFHNPGTFQPSYTVHNARVAYTFENFEIGAFVDNFTDEVYKNNAFVFGVAAGTLAFWAPRRTWGVFANARF